MLTSARQACVPVAQWIEHLPCWSLNEERILEELIKWTAPYAGTPLEPLVLDSSNNPGGLGNPQETFLA